MYINGKGSYKKQLRKQTLHQKANCMRIRSDPES